MNGLSVIKSWSNELAYLDASNDWNNKQGSAIEPVIPFRSINGSQSPVFRECELKRHAAYFRGWCQAFGEHESIEVDGNGSYWLLAEQQVGLVLPKPLVKTLYREVLLHEKIPILTFNQQGVRIGAINFPFMHESEKQVLEAIKNLIDAGPDFHVFLTSHLLYGGGNRIITFSNKRPLSIIYKEIGTMHIRLH